jgi:FkbM family methyltransferase
VDVRPIHELSGVLRARICMQSFSESRAIFDYFSNRAAGVMIDVGAHTGTTFRPFLDRGWRVLAAEPDPSKFPALDRFAGVDNFSLLPVALGDCEETERQFFTSSESTGISSLIPFRASHVPSAMVRVTTLARVIEEYGIERVEFLKIDTEGYDERVLRGFPWWRLKPEVILCEFDEQKQCGLDSDYRSLGHLLLSQGYHVYISEWDPIERYGGSHRWRDVRPFPCTLAHPAAWGNFIALRAGADVARLERVLPQDRDVALAA